MERHRIVVSGIVQGVGFRPFVYGLAVRRGLGGFVRNQSGSVVIEVEGPTPELDRFLEELSSAPPPLARIADVAREQLSAAGERAFRIVASAAAESGEVFISPDVATCADCERELFDPADRRFRYPFLNCTHCGPRFTIVREIPYDRERTTMAGFPMCAPCRAEYDDPADRRFHAQPTACPECGPRLAWYRAGAATDASERPPPAATGEEALEAAARALEAGRIVAIKGLGGFHLACDAAREETVAELRRRKGREAKPLAVMVPDLETARRLCRLDGGAAEVLDSPRRPILLAPRRTPAEDPADAGPPEVAPSVAPGIADLGLLLPYTPLHLLLMDRLRRPIVLTSANRGGAPIVADDAAAHALLPQIADGLLGHDRPIAARCDDSVVRWTGRRAIPVRRSRGQAPEPLLLGGPLDGSQRAPEPVLAVGAHQKNVFCLLDGRRAIPSQHIGDLDHPDTIAVLEDELRRTLRLFGIEPAAVACDLHPDYASTRLAERFARERGIPLIPVQHHHAHAAAAAAEHGLGGEVLALVLDGTGLGTDDTVWGFEVLAVDGAQMERLGHLETVALPGGAAAVREPWRMALAWLRAAAEPGGSPPLPPAPLDGIDPQARRLVEQMIERGVHSPPTSSAGRLFDAVAALLGLRLRAAFEGQPAMELEALASAAGRTGSADAPPYPVELVEPAAGAGGESPFALRFAPAIREIAAESERPAGAGPVAARFHATVVRSLVLAAEHARARRGLERVVLSGGTFQNALLLEGAVRALEATGFAVHVHARVPPNDGGLALGQAVVAAAGRRREREGPAPPGGPAPG